VDLEYTKEQVALREELRGYFTALIPPDVGLTLRETEGIGDGLGRRLIKQMGDDGWLGVGWPTEYGGRGFALTEQSIFFDEAARAGAPVPVLSINSVAPTIMKYGTDEQKSRFLPGILAGELVFCIGYTEPEAGTDLAALRTSAVLDGDAYVINGQKIFTSLVPLADFVWLAVRTDPDPALRHKGVSMLIVPLDTPGITVQKMNVLGGTDVSSVFYEDVRVPVENLVGGENRGWALVMNQLNNERVTLTSPGVVERLLEDTYVWAEAIRRADGSRLIDEPWVQSNLARVYANLEALRLIAAKLAAGDVSENADVPLASTAKVFGTEFYNEAGRLLFEVLGEAGTLRGGSPLAVSRGILEFQYRKLLILTFGGGTNELQRDLIAQFGLNMPVAKRGKA
jgi:3-oxocholest-4-en-26-oyl-CoA dehydrogenase alpha subunit